MSMGDAEVSNRSAHYRAQKALCDSGNLGGSCKWQPFTDFIAVIYFYKINH